MENPNIMAIHKIAISTWWQCEDIESSNPLIPVLQQHVEVGGAVVRSVQL